jgi:signal transduction histidine kinase
MSEADSKPVTFLDRWTRLSLARRIMLAAAIWGLIVLIGGAFALSALYRAQTLSLLSDDLDQTLITLTRDMTREGAFLPDGRVTDDDHVFLSTDSRYQTQYSGRYWAIVAVNDAGEPVGDLRSRSLWDEPVPMSPRLLARALETPGTTQFGIGPGPAGQRIFAAAKAIIVENRDTPLVLVAAADRAQNDAAATRFRNLLLGTMIVLFGSVFAAMWAGIRYSLRPLVKLGHDIAEIREGTRLKLADDYPTEIRPLTEELNKLVDHNRQVVERARTHVGNLAHALKTPIAVLRNEATGESQLDDVVRRQVDSMQTNVEHYLKRARMLNRLYDARGIDVTVSGPAAAVFRGEQQDLEEMVGNLMENACKWAKADVAVSVHDDAGEMRIEVDDDGPGLTREEREGALKRGVRLDETTPGTGLGLSIVTELAELHKGVLELDESPAGGLRARLRFPKR